MAWPFCNDTYSSLDHSFPSLMHVIILFQSYASDEAFSKMLGSPKRLFSYTGSRRKRDMSGGDSNSVDPLERQTSLKYQASNLTQLSADDSVGGKILSQKEKQDLWDKDVPQVGLFFFLKH